MTKILVVDDQLSWRTFHTNAIKKIINEDMEIDTADSANSGYTKVLENINSPYNIIITDMQMENDYEPKMAGEWFIEQIKMLSSYYKTKIIIVSASPKIKQIAESYNVIYLPKSAAAASVDGYRKYLSQ